MAQLCVFYYRDTVCLIFAQRCLQICREKDKEVSVCIVEKGAELGRSAPRADQEHHFGATKVQTGLKSLLFANL